MLRHLAAAAAGAVVGAVTGYLVGYAVGEIVLRDCFELDCILVGLYALGGAVLFALAGGITLAVMSVRRGRAQPPRSSSTTRRGPWTSARWARRQGRRGAG